MMMRTNLFGMFIMLAIVGFAQSALAQQDQPKRPNILFVFTDDHGPQAISAYGSRVNQTPNIDRIANEGMLFRHCLVTNSICGPSRAVILTGKYSHLNGFRQNGDRFDGAQQTFPKLLRKVGYQTALIGKWHLDSEPTGFDYWEVLPGQGHYYNPDFITSKGRHRETGYVTDLVTDKALNWLKHQRDADKPFMLMCQHKAPHRSWRPGPGHLNLYDDVEIPEPATLFDDQAGRGSGAKDQKMSIARHMYLHYDLKVPPTSEEAKNLQGPDRHAASYLKRMTPKQRSQWDAAYGPKNDAFRQANLQGDDLIRWKYQRYVKDYLRCIASVDDNIGRLLDYLDEAGLAENTVVIYSSDQGWFLGEHGWYDKRWMYEESLTMPLVVRWPGAIQAGSQNNDMVSNVDFAETFLDLAGALVPADMQGRSLVSLLKDQTPDDWRKSFYYHYYEGGGEHNVPRHDGVRTRSRKLIHFYDLGEWELYDLEKDQDELISVHNDPAYAAELAELTTELQRLRIELQIEKSQ